MRRRRVRLPQGHDVTREFELPAEDSGMHHRRQHLAQLESSPRETCSPTDSPRPCPNSQRGHTPNSAGFRTWATGLFGIVIPCYRPLVGVCAAESPLPLPHEQHRQSNPTDRLKVSQAFASRLLSCSLGLLFPVSSKKRPPQPGGLVSCLPGTAQPAACSICSASISKFECTFCTSSRSSRVSSRRTIWFAAFPSSLV